MLGHTPGSEHERRPQPTSAGAWGGRCRSSPSPRSLYDARNPEDMSCNLAERSIDSEMHLRTTFDRGKGCYERNEGGTVEEEKL
jgi:hypothetical protein